MIYANITVLKSYCIYECASTNAQLDMGRVFDEEQQAIVHKWLLLSDPDDATSNAKGYVKVCVAIIGPGDEPPVSIETSTSVQAVCNDKYSPEKFLDKSGKTVKSFLLVIVES